MEDEDAANLESFLQWATELGISDSNPSTTLSEEESRRSSCLGHSLVIAHFPDAGGYYNTYPFGNKHFEISLCIYRHFYMYCIVFILYLVWLYYWVCIGISRRGLAAARDIRKGELILTVPKGVLMTSESFMMKDSKLSGSIKRHSTLSSTQVLFLFPTYHWIFLCFFLFLLMKRCDPSACWKVIQQES